MRSFYPDLHLEDVVKLDKLSLVKIFAEGVTPDWACLKDFELRGYNIAAGFNLSVLSSIGNIKKFKKGFFEREGRRMGYNVPAVQNKISEPWISKPSDSNPKKFGFFTVDAVDSNDVDNKFDWAVLLDYGKGGNGIFGPPLRDYLVQVNDNVFLGYAYLAFGKARVGLSYFVLEK